MTSRPPSTQALGAQRAARPWIALFVIVGTGLVVRLALAVATDGTNDVDTWLAFFDAARTHGALHLYGVTEWPTVPMFDFNHGPLVAFGIQVAAWVQEILPVGERLLPRLPAIAADAGSTLLVFHLVAGRFGSRRGLLAAALVAFNPVLILVSGFHGNTDPVFVALVLLAIVLLARQRSLPAGVVFAAAIAVKVVALLAAPAILLSIGTARERRRFVWATLAASATLWLPALLLDPAALIREVFLYRGSSGIWGVSVLASSLGGDLGAAGLRELWTLLVIAAIAASGWVLAMTGRSAAAFSIAAAFLVFLALTPGFGVQYLAWPVVFLVLAAPGFGAVYSAAAGAFLFATYAGWSGGGWSLGYANAWGVDPLWSPATEAAKQLLWILIVALAYLMHRRRPAETAVDRIDPVVPAETPVPA